jgi:hypothetical protein
VNEEALAHWGLLWPKKNFKRRLKFLFTGNLTNETALNVGIMLSAFNKYYSTNL